MKNNKIIPFSLLFITLTFLELFCIVKYSDVFYFPLAVGATLLGSAYLLFTEIGVTVSSFLKERNKPDETSINDSIAAEKEEASKLARATYVLEKRILNLLEERVLMPEENMENQSMLQREVVNAIKASIKYERENTKYLANIISNNGNTSDNSMESGDFIRILEKLDELALELKNNQLTMGAVKEQLQTITDIARQISNNKTQYMNRTTPVTDDISANTEYNEPVSEEIFNEPVVGDTEPAIKKSSHNEEIAAEALGEEAESISEEISPENISIAVAPETDDNLEDMPEFVDTLTMSKPAEAAPVVDDPNKQMSPDDIAALFAASEPEPVQTPEPVADDPNKQMSPDDIAALFATSEPEPVQTPEPVADDPNKQMSPDDIAALFAASESEPVQTPEPVADDPNKQMSPDDIAALFASANLELEPEPSAPETKTAIEALSKPAPEVAPVSDDPNKKMSPEDIAALFASAGQ